MAKRPSSDNVDPFDLNDDADLNNLDVDINDLRIEDSGDLDAELLEAVEAPATRPPLTIMDVLSGTIKVVLIALLVIVIFLAVGFGAIFGGQQLGLVPTRPNATLSIASLSNLLPSQIAPLAGATQSAATSVPALPTLTPDLACAGATTWWNSQQISDNYTYFSVQALTDASDPARTAAVLEQMRIRRDFVANFPADPCVSSARDAMLRAMDATIEAARAAGAGDQAALRQKRTAQEQTFAVLTAALWAVNVDLDSDSAPAQGVARNTGASCGAQSWHDSIKSHVDTFQTTADQIDLTIMPESAVRPLINTMQAARDAIAALAPPICASHAQTLLMGALNGYLQTLEGQIAERSASGDYSASTRQFNLYLAWLSWLGVS